MKHVAIVEDNDQDAYLIQRKLCLMGFLTSVCTNAHQLAEYLMSGNVDVIVTDLSLPDIGGIEIIKRTRRIGSNVPLVVISSYCESEVMQECLDAGATHYIAKPFNCETISKVFTQYL